MPSPHDGQQWIRQAVDRFEGPLTLYAARLLGGDVERARDVVQDTFLRLWESDHASVDGHLAQWLYRVCRNRALDVRRKESRMTTTLETAEVRDQKSDLGMQIHVGSTTSDLRPPPSESAGVMRLIETLSEKQQEVLRLKFQGGLSYAEIATVMEITVNHVGVMIHTAIKTLRERMNASESQPAKSTPSAVIRGEVLS